MPSSVAICSLCTALLAYRTHTFAHTHVYKHTWRENTHNTYKHTHWAYFCEFGFRAVSQSPAETSFHHTECVPRSQPSQPSQLIDLTAQDAPETQARLVSQQEEESCFQTEETTALTELDRRSSINNGQTYDTTNAAFILNDLSIKF